MALNATRLRRALSLSTLIITHKTLYTTASTTTSLSSLLQTHHSAAAPPPSLRRLFHSTHLSLSSPRSFNDVDKIDPDTILFEGCDYKHWLIVMDFGKDPQQRPSNEEMVETYVQTLAKVVGSVEEAKKRMYACSTTTYTGFQAEVDEETANKFEGMPGVIFVLPDSYIDPVNKEYGGDKYVNGIIIPRPPPVQYGRMKRGRQNDQRPPTYGEGRVLTPNGPPERQNTPYYGPPGQGGRSYPMQNRTNYSEQGRDGFQGGGNTTVPLHQGGGNNYAPPRQGGGDTFVPPRQGGGNTYVPPRQGGGNTFVPPHQGGGDTFVPPRPGGGDTFVPPYHGGGNTFVPPHQGNGNTFVPPHQGGGNTFVPPHQGGGNTFVPPHQGAGNTFVPPQQGNYNRGYTHQRQMENFPNDSGTHVPCGQINNRLGEHGYNHPQGQMNNFPGNHGGYQPQEHVEYPSNERSHALPPPARGAEWHTGAGRYGQGPSGTSSQGASTSSGPGYEFQAENQKISDTRKTEIYANSNRA